MSEQLTATGRWAEDTPIGEVRDLGSYEVTEREIVDFASRWDPQFFHTDPQRATSEGAFGGLIASGIHTMAIYQRLEITSRTQEWHVIGGTGIKDLVLRRPVRPGDVLTGTSEIVDRRLEPERRRGLLTFAGQLVNQSGELVLSLQVSAYVHMRPLATPADPTHPTTDQEKA